jgi:hypothetical protein
MVFCFFVFVRECFSNLIICLNLGLISVVFW